MSFGWVPPTTNCGGFRRRLSRPSFPQKQERFGGRSPVTAVRISH
jgi:hypothetical protein